MRRSTELWLIVPDIVPAIVPATVPSTHYSTSYSTQNGHYVQYPFWVLYSFFTVPAIVPQMGTVHSTGFGYYIVPSTVPKNRVLRSTPWVLYSTRQGSHRATTLEFVPFTSKPITIDICNKYRVLYVRRIR
jgi:hypothetical protein